MSEHAPTPWSYRPQKYDDWGYIRGPKEPDGFAPLVAIARGEASETHDSHRAAGTDPYGPNALLIVKAVNNHDALMKALEQIAVVCTDNMGRDCEHRMALDFVRQVANDARDAVGGSVDPS